MKKTVIKVPKALLWDYKEAPADNLWRLQRLADFFPRWGNDKNTVAELYKNIKKLKVDIGTKALIKVYYDKYKRK